MYRYYRFTVQMEKVFETAWGHTTDEGWTMKDKVGLTVADSDDPMKALAHTHTHTHTHTHNYAGMDSEVVFMSVAGGVCVCVCVCVCARARARACVFPLLSFREECLLTQVVRRKIVYYYVRPTSAYYAPNRFIDIHPKSAYMHPRVSAYMHPNVPAYMHLIPHTY